MSTLPSTYVEGFHDKEKVMKMKYNDLGTTGMRVSHLSYGAGCLSSFYDAFDEDEAIQTIREAIRSGVNYIDTAPWYGQGRSEMILGKALKNIPREAYYIATKVGRYELNYEDMFNFSAEKVRNSFVDSLKKLGLNYVDIIQVHDVEFAPNLDIVLNETLPCLDVFRQNGKAKFIGITGYPLSTLKDAVKASKVKIDTILTYCRYSLIDGTLDDYVDFFKSNNIGIIGAAGHAMGLLTNRGPQPWHPASDLAKKVCKDAADYCKSKNTELGRLAAWHAMGNQYVNTHLIGMSDRKLLHSNLSVLYDGLTKEELNVLEHINKQYFQQIKNCHWEGVEVKRYWENVNNKNAEKRLSPFN